MREILTKTALFHPKTTSATRFFAFIHAACTAAFAHTQRFIDLMLQVVRLSTKMFTLSSLSQHSPIACAIDNNVE